MDAQTSSLVATWLSQDSDEASRALVNENIKNNKFDVIAKWMAPRIAFGTSGEISFLFLFLFLFLSLSVKLSSTVS